jgi:hypothetical protein
MGSSWGCSEYNSSRSLPSWLGSDGRRISAIASNVWLLTVVPFSVSEQRKHTVRIPVAVRLLVCAKLVCLLPRSTGVAQQIFLRKVVATWHTRAVCKTRTLALICSVFQVALQPLFDLNVSDSCDGLIYIVIVRFGQQVWVLGHRDDAPS